MTIPYSRWPADFARRYRQQGYWLDLPLSDILWRQRENDAIALYDNNGDINNNINNNNLHTNLHNNSQRQFSYRQLNQYADQLAAAFTRQGLVAGDTALVQLANEAELIIVFFALLKCGIAPVNALFSHQRNELEAYARQIQPKLLIADRQHPLFQDQQFIARLREISPALQCIALHHDQSAQSLQALMRQPVADSHFAPSAADEVAFFQLSGGSTGTPKLIPRTHNDYYYSIRRSVEICRFNQQTRYLCAIPAAHNYAMSSPGWLGVFYGAGCVVLAADPDPLICLPLIAHQQVNVAALVPPAVSLWLQALAQWGSRQQLASLQLLQVGGAKLSEALARRIPAELGCQLQQVFGMAEGLVNYTRLDDDAERIFTSQGKPMCDDDEVWVADASGNPLPCGEAGRLMVRGPYTFRGYYRSDEHNAQVFDSEGFYCSGDLITIDKDRYIRVVGREKDQINRGGEKIAAEEIENLLAAHSGILQVALVSMEDSLLGEKSCAFVVPDNAAQDDIQAKPLRAADIRRYLRKLGVAEYKLPDRLELINELPLTAAGKADKKQLRQWIAQRQLAANTAEKS